MGDEIARLKQIIIERMQISNRRMKRATSNDDIMYFKGELSAFTHIMRLLQDIGKEVND